ncbi:hypothetical protein B0H66DRAFT_581349 [Apodospora peruviana]|uniref:Uncharacterized protein n=1 Tax=Apodospora peruviana TaxID=516989 RepID=A0AAE0IB78_9PEZI|nr:hypothetical protein B0H66DRAFT_581349 [Apodospora peruviana]
MVLSCLLLFILQTAAYPIPNTRPSDVGPLQEIQTRSESDSSVWSGTREFMYVPSVLKTMPKGPENHNRARDTSLAQFSCSSLVYGLSAADCVYMAEIGMLGQGNNSLEDNGLIWIGADGPNTFTFVNAADVPLILILWYAPQNDDQASFMNARVPAISYSLPNTGSAVELSVANGLSGAWSTIYDRSTALTAFGQVDNTFGEFSSGVYATVDVSRLVNMSGDPMTIMVSGESGGSGGCVSDMSTCVYTCDAGTGNSCGTERTYSLLNCGGPNAVKSMDSDGNPTGGCQGWSFGGHIDIVLTGPDS